MLSSGLVARAGCALVFGDELELGISFLERAVLLGPKDPNHFSILSVAACGHLFNGRTERAIELAERSAALNQSWDSTFWVLTAAYALENRTPEAKAALARLLAAAPD